MPVTKFGTEFLVNTTTLLTQFDPVVTTLANGRFAVAWSDLSLTGGDTSGSAVRAQVFDADGARIGDEFLVNTTTLGMKGQPSLDLDPGALPEDAVVTDLVYVPLETPLLAAARARGLRTADGLGMLLHQAVPGFEHWFGKRPSVSPALRATILKTLEG